MAQNSAFSRPAFGTGTSWADDDDLDLEPLPLPTALPKLDEQELPRAESPRREQQPERRDRKYSNESHDRDHGYGHGRRDRGGYEDRGDRGDRGGYRNERRDERAPRGGYEGERPKNPVPDQGPYKVYMGNLPFRASEHDIVDFFGMSEAVTDVRLQRDPVTDRPKGFAYVEFRDRDALVEALKLDGQDFDGRAVRVDVATDGRKQRQTGSFFEKRGDRPERGDRGGRFERRGQDEPRSEAPRERPRLSLLPRTSENKENKDGAEVKKQSIFGEAKPRDEAAFWERKKAKEVEREPKPKSEHTKKGGPRERKTSHDEAAEGRGAGGRGGRGRGDRPERAERAGGRGRGAAAANAAAQPERTPAKKEEPKPKKEEPKAKKEEPKPKKEEPKPKKEEPKPKTVEAKAPKITKMPAPASTKTKNAFELLNDDSDSD